MSASSATLSDSAFPLAKGERIEVRGSLTSYLKTAETLTLSCPLERERRSYAGRCL